ncbi:Replicative DNA helicase (DnaB) [Streptococcus sp. DD10]|uniref:DnaB-like helicase C-terminal domain-containing protein n=1 Tax=Streptococcus sp. DD10 TaxID=1777878 RepID=UPI00079251E1|nr:DnaB-like helicase C-terminal domain-containing protein [Streptococcus sp. DD10]KXT72328.1 Replicative DNA helicase (DnaB) [Streptococcus sp. DD10]
MVWTEEKLQMMYCKKYPHRRLKLEMKGDRITCLQKGNVTVLTGKPAIGKSRLSFQVIYDVILQNKNVICFSLQRSTESLVIGLIKQCSDATPINIKTEACYKWDRAIFDNGNSLYIDDTPGIKINDMIHRTIELCQSVGDIQLMVVDYLQLILEHQKLETREKNDELLISRCLKNLAIDLNIPILLISHLKFQERDYLHGNKLDFTVLNKLIKDRVDCDDIIYLYE